MTINDFCSKVRGNENNSALFQVFRKINRLEQPAQLLADLGLAGWQPWDDGVDPLPAEA